MRGGLTGFATEREMGTPEAIGADEAGALAADAATAGGLRSGSSLGRSLAAW